MIKKTHAAVAAIAAVLALSACASTPVGKAPKNIVQVASENGTFNTLVAVVKAAGLAETLQG